MGVERLFKSFLVRNGRVNSHGLSFLRASAQPVYPKPPRCHLGSLPKDTKKMIEICEAGTRCHIRHR